MRAGVIAALGMMLCGPAPVSAQTAGTDALATRERDAVHLTDALRANDPKLTDTFDGAADSLRAGHELVILFDGWMSSVFVRRNSRPGPSAWGCRRPGRRATTSS